MVTSKKAVFKKFQYYQFILPGFLLIGLLISYPLISNVIMSVSKDGTLTINNFWRVIQDSSFLITLKNTLLWMFFTVVFASLLGFGSAILIEQNFVKHKSIWRSLILLAWITPGIVKAHTWKWLFSYDFGMLNYMLVSFGLVKEPVYWLSSASAAFIAVVLIQVWSEFPYVMLMISAGIQSINTEYYDCALLDGASYFRYIWSIVIPIIRDVVFISILLLTIWSINTFSVIWIVTQGGPYGSTNILSIDIYRKFLMFDLGGASATALLQLSISLIITIIYIKQSKKAESNE
ncbi:MAG: sugar ABC transporter permease [Candidatus Omnitrophica bacterium]|nr:sugar ABC transporter permease [Candidatus Omnitrophota bacterium]